MDGKHPYFSRTPRNTNRNKENQPTRSASQPASSLSSDRNKSRMYSDSKLPSLVTKSQDQADSNALRPKSKLVNDHVPQATAERLEFRARQRQNNTNECLKRESKIGFPFANSNNVRDKRVPLSQSRPTQSGQQVSTGVTHAKHSYVYPKVKRMGSSDLPDSSCRSRLPIRSQHSLSNTAIPTDRPRSRSLKKEDSSDDAHTDSRFLTKIPRRQNGSERATWSKIESLYKRDPEIDSETLGGLQSDSLRMPKPSGDYISSETFMSDAHRENKNPTEDASKIIQDNMEFISSPLLADKTQSDNYFTSAVQNNSSHSQSKIPRRQVTSSVPLSPEISANDERSDDKSNRFYLWNNFGLPPSALDMESRESQIPRFYSSEPNSPDYKHNPSDFTKQESLDISKISAIFTNNEGLDNPQNVPTEYNHKESKKIQSEEDFETLAPRLVADPVDIEDFKPIHKKIIPHSPNSQGSEDGEFIFLNSTKDSLTNDSAQVEYVIADSEIKEFFNNCVTSEKLTEETERKSGKAFSGGEESKSNHQNSLPEIVKEPQSSDADSNSIEADSLELNCTVTDGIEPSEAVVGDLRNNVNLENDKGQPKIDQGIIGNPFVPTVATDYSFSLVDANKNALAETERDVIEADSLETSFDTAQPLQLTGEESEGERPTEKMPSVVRGQSLELNREVQSNGINADTDNFNDSSLKSSISSFSSESQEDIDATFVAVNHKQGFKRFEKIRSKLQAIFSPNVGKAKHSAKAPLVEKTKDAIVEEKITEPFSEDVLQDEIDVIESTATGTPLNDPEQIVYINEEDEKKGPIIENTNERNQREIKFLETSDGLLPPNFNESNMHTGENDEKYAASKKEFKTTNDSAMEDELKEELYEFQCANQFSQIPTDSEIKEFFQGCLTSEKLTEKSENDKNISENQLNYTETSGIIACRIDEIQYQNPELEILPQNDVSSEDQKAESKLPPEVDNGLKSPERNLPETINPDATSNEDSDKNNKTEADETKNKKSENLKKPLFGFVPRLKRAFAFKSDKNDQPSNDKESENITATDAEPVESTKEPKGTSEEARLPSETTILGEVLQSDIANCDIVTPTIQEVHLEATNTQTVPFESPSIKTGVFDQTKFKTDELLTCRPVDSFVEGNISDTETLNEELDGKQEEFVDGHEETEEDIFYFEPELPAKNPETEDVTSPTTASDEHLDRATTGEEIGAKKSRRWYEKVKDFFGSKKSGGSFDEMINGDSTFRRSDSYHPKLLDSDVAPGSYGSPHWSDIVDEKVVATLPSDSLREESISEKRVDSENDPSTADRDKPYLSRMNSIHSLDACIPKDNYNEDYLGLNEQFGGGEYLNLSDQNSVVEVSLPDLSRDNNEPADQMTKPNSLKVSDQTQDVDLAAETVQSIETPPKFDCESTVTNEDDYKRPWKMLSEVVVGEEPEMTVPLNIKKLMVMQSTTSSGKFLSDETHQNFDSLNEDEIVEPELQGDQLDTKWASIPPEEMVDKMEAKHMAGNQATHEYIPDETFPSDMVAIGEIVDQSNENALLEVFAYLDHKTLSVTSQVCKQWRQLSYHPSLWKHVVFSHRRMTSKFLIHFSDRCSQLKSLRFENIQGRPKRRGESERYYQQEMRASVEPGLESVLIKAEGNLNELTIINCGPVITERCLWLVSCYARVLRSLTYRSVAHPPSAEVLWALASGCRDITYLSLSPDNPRSPQQERFNNKCAYLIAKNYPHLKFISLGGAGIDDVGLLIIAEKCQNLECLELYNFVNKLIQSSVENMCINGFQNLQELYFIHTAVDPKIIPEFARLCPKLKKIKIEVTIQDYFGDILQPKDKRKYKLIGLKLKSLKSHSKLDHILELDFKDCK